MPFSIIKGRYIVIAWFLPLFYLPGAETILHSYGEDWTWYQVELFYYYYNHALLFVTLLVLAHIGRLNWSSLFGQRNIRSELVPGLKLTLYLLLFSIATAYLLFLPLSYFIPDFVAWWYIDAITIIYTDGETYPVLANMLNFISLVILAPLLEELAFRGFLLHRWTHKWGAIKAMLLASFLFAIVHADPIGAFAFGIGMSILYLRTQSLWLPVVCHAANNLTVWLMEFGFRIIEGPTYEYTLETFQNEWYVGLGCGVLVIVWTYAFTRKPVRPRNWDLPIITQRSRL